MRILGGIVGALAWSSLALAQNGATPDSLLPVHAFLYLNFSTLTATGSSSASTPLPISGSGTSIVLTNYGTTLVSCTPAIGAAVGARNNIPVPPNGGQTTFEVGNYDHLACIDQGGSDTTSNLIALAGGTGLFAGGGGGGGGSSGGPSANVNVIQLGGNGVATGIGPTTTGTQRTTLANDSPGIVPLGQTTKALSVPFTMASDQGALAVSGTFFQATQPISAAALPLPTGAATSALQSAMNTTLGSPFQTGGSIGNTTFASTQSGNWTVRNVGNAGAVLDFAGQNAASPANSWLIGGQFNTTPTTLTSGNSSPFQLDAAARLLINCAVGCAGGTTSNAGSAVATSSSNGASVAYNYGFNGASWDQLQVDANKALKVSATGVARLAPYGSQGGSIIMGLVETSAAAGTNGNLDFPSLTAGGRALRSDLASVGGSAFALGQTTKSASIPVTPASDPATATLPVITAASDNHQVLAAAARVAKSIHASNAGATKGFVRLYDATTGFNGCGSTTGLIFAFEAPPNDSGFTIPLGGGDGLVLANGLSLCVTGAQSLTDTSNAPTTIVVDASYK